MNILITGATGKIGNAICENLSLKKNINLFLIIRDEKKIKIKNKKIKYYCIDLSNKNEIDNFIKNFKIKKLDILINTAAIVNDNFILSKDNIELQFTVNVLSYFRLMNGLLPLLKKGDNPKIINVSSLMTLNFNDPNILQPKKIDYDNSKQYARCKCAIIMLSKKASELWEKYNIYVYSCHPGVTLSNVLKGLHLDKKNWKLQTPEKCASTIIYLINNIEKTGTFWERSKIIKENFNMNELNNNKLWNYCLKYK